MTRQSGTDDSDSRFCPIAVTGLSVFCPEVQNLRDLWQLIGSGRNIFSADPTARWKPEPYFRADRWDSNGIYATAGGFLQARPFHPMEWKIPPATMASIDPVHLLAMTLAAEALEDAGVHAADFPRERTAVIFASSGGELGLRHAFQTLSREYVAELECLDPDDRARVLDEWDRRLPRWTEDSFAGYLSNVLTGRIANRYGLGGTSYVVDAACASSLAAVQAGVQQLQLGAADAAVVGAADASNHPFCYMSFARSQALSPRGSSRPFDQQADGIVLGEGMSVMVLRRLDDALASGQPIHAVIRGIGSSSDGCGRSVTAPDLGGQRRCLEAAYRLAACPPHTVGLIEAHGTGTALGDGVELQSLLSWLGPTAPAGSVALGSIKAQIGHCKSAAGMLGLAKAILALEAQCLPPTGKVEQPRTPLSAADCPLYLNTEPRPWWREAGQPRRAGVSAFGFGGSNFHVVLEESPRPQGERLPWSQRPAELFGWARETRSELQAALREFLELASELTQDDFTLWAAAQHQTELNQTEVPRLRSARAAIVASTPEQLIERLQLLLRELERLPDQQAWSHHGAFLSLAPAVDPRQVCFVYPGQGTPAIGMFRDLILADLQVRPALEAFDDAYRQRHPDGPRLVDLIWPRGTSNASDRQAQQRLLSATEHAQPALGAIATALTNWLSASGIVPAATAGHSYGEFAALWAAGALSLADLAQLSVERGVLCATAAEATPGGMVAVELNVERVQALLDAAESKLTIANINAPEQTVCAGSVAACEQFVERLKIDGIQTRRLSVTGAFHTEAMRSVADDWERLLANTGFCPPHLPVYSNTTGAKHPETVETLRETLARHLSSRVDFVSEIRTMLADGFRVFIEVGPGTVLSSLIRRIAGDQSVITLNFGSAGPESLLSAGHLLAHGFVLGLPVDFAPWFRGRAVPMTLAGLLEQLHERKLSREKSWMVSPTGVIPPVGKRFRQPAPTTSLGSSNRVDGGTPSPALPTVFQPLDNPAPGPAPPREPPRPAVSASPRLIAPEIIPPCKTDQIVSQLRPEDDHGSSWAPFLQLAQRWFDLQSQQQTVADRIFRLQEMMLTGQLPPTELRGLSQSVESPIAPRALPPVARVSAAPEPMPGVTNGKANGHERSMKTPAPAPIAGVPRDYEYRVAQSTGPVATQFPVKERVGLPAQPVKPPEPAPVATQLTRKDSGVPPTVEEFREHLLTVVSDRTGYEREILDENLPLEAGLGIDSIKVVEILSKMQDFYAAVRLEGASDESVLQEFVNLKTLADIIGGYQSARQRFLEEKQGASVVVSESSPVPALEHYAVVAEAAEPGPGAPRKN